MANKSNIRSMRISDDILAMIESQAGETFTAKFENLVTRCMWELPRKEEELKQIQEKIDFARQQLKTVTFMRTRIEESTYRLDATLLRAITNIKLYEEQISKIMEKCNT